MNPRMTKLSIALLQALGAGLAASVATMPVMAQQPASKERIEVTGSNIKKVTEEQTQPVIVITREEIQRSGAVNIEQLLNSLPATSTMGAFTSSQLAGLSTYGISSVSLRGLGGSRTLVLLNGRRVAPFAQSTSNVDINAIPVSAIERIEVLTDGASSVYGSDAVAGVINFILRKDFTGIEASAEYGKPTRSGGGKVEKYNATLGLGNLNDNRYNFMLSLSEKKEQALFARDRDFSRSGNVPPYLASGATPSGRIEGVYVPGSVPSSNAATGATGSNPFGISSRGYGNPGRDNPGGCEAMNMYPNTGTPRAGTGQNCNFDSAPYVGLFPKTKNDNVFATAAFQIAPQAQIFAEVLWNQNKVTETYQPSPVRYAFLVTDTSFAGSGVDQALLIYPGNPNYPSAWLNSHGLSAMNGRPLAVSLRTFLTGPRTEEDKNTQTRGVVGLKGTVRDWDYEIAGTWDKSKSEGGVIDGYFSQLGLARIINTVGNTAGTYWNPWAVAGVQNDALTTALQGIKYVGPTASAEQTLKAIDAKTSGILKEMAAGPLAVAFGAGLRKEEYIISTPPILLQGDIAGLGGATLPQNGDRTTSFVFGEVNIPITKTVEANFSGRVDHYDDLKKDSSPATGKLSLRWNPTPQLLFRGNLGKGFRAPALGELHQPQSLGTSEQFVDPLFAAAGPVQANAIIGGSPDLKPEKSKQYSIGAVFSPTPAVTLRADFWRIRIDDYIIGPAALAMVNAARAGGFLYRPGEVVFAPDGEVDSVDERLANAASAEFRGYDVGAQWRGQFGFGRLALDYNGTYYTKADLKTLVGTEQNIGTIVDADGNALALASQGGVLLRYKHVVSLNWASGPWNATVIQNYWAGYRTGDNNVDGARHDVGPFETFDLQGEFTGIKHVKFAVGAKNVLDKNPHLYVSASNYFQFGYDPSIYDPRARFIYGRVTVSFR